LETLEEDKFMAQQTATGNGQAISNLEYDLLTVLQNKAEAVQAYDSYIQDAQSMGSQPCAELFQKLKESEMQQVQEIREHLTQVMQHGKM
jgi:rubrerythrin